MAAKVINALLQYVNVNSLDSTAGYLQDKLVDSEGEAFSEIEISGVAKLVIPAGTGGGGAFTAEPSTEIAPTSPIVLEDSSNEISLDLSTSVNKIAGNYTGIFADFTEMSAPGSDNMLLDFRVDGTSAMTLNANGTLTVGNPSNPGLGALSIGNSGTVQLLRNGSNLLFRVGGATFFNLSSDGIAKVRSEDAFAWSSTASLFGAPDLVLRRDSANTLALRNGDNAQAINLYSTFTDASNYERLSINHVSDVITFSSESAGTGFNRNFNFAGGGVGIGSPVVDGSALLEMSSDVKGFLPPRMSTTDRDNIISPATGLIVYNSTTNALNFFNGSVWDTV